MTGHTVIAILAAGSGSRMGGGKLDRALAGKPLGRHALDRALELDAGPALLVVGEETPAFARDAAAQGKAELLVNREAETGLASSVATAARHAAVTGGDRLLLLLADMPLVDSETLETLVDACRPGIPSAVRYASGAPGIPACFPADWFEALQALSGDRGAGPLLREAEELTLVEPGADALRDADTERDLAGMEALLATRPG